MPTGILFERQTTKAIVDAVEHFEEKRTAVLPSACRQNAMRFSPERFAREITLAFAEAESVHERSY
jgi:hypothetical protein